jgi:hypothetical protein
MQTAPLTVLDELYLQLDREPEPFSVHIEIRVEGRIDATRLEAAVREAALRHPIAAPGSRALVPPMSATAGR